MTTREYLRHELESLRNLLADVLPKTRTTSPHRRVMASIGGSRSGDEPTYICLSPARGINLTHIATPATGFMYGDLVHETQNVVSRRLNILRTVECT